MAMRAGGMMARGAMDRASPVDNANGVTSITSGIGAATKELVDELEEVFKEYVPPPKEGWVFYIEHNFAHGFVNVMIVLNAGQMGVAVDIKGNGWDDVWTACEMFFAVFFFFEMLTKFAVLHKKYFGTSLREPDIWNMFDFGIAWSSMFDVFSPIVWPPEDGAEKGGTSIIGLLRLLRLLRMMKLMRVVPQFRILFEGILKALHSMFWVSALCSFIVYMVAVACVVLVGGEDAGFHEWSNDVQDLEASGASEFNNYQYFGTVRRSMLSLYGFIVMAELDAIIRPLWEIQPVIAVFLLVLSFVMMFGVLNILVGMIMDNVMQTVKDMDQEAMKKAQKKRALFIQELSNAVFALDKDGSGSISISELEDEHNNHFLRLVGGFNLPHRFSLEQLFTMVDLNAEGQVKKEDFLEGMFRIVLNDEFQRDCMVQLRLSTLRQEVRSIHHDLRQGMQDMRESFALQLGHPPPQQAACAMPSTSKDSPVSDAATAEVSRGRSCDSDSGPAASSSELLEKISRDVDQLSARVLHHGTPRANLDDANLEISLKQTFQHMVQTEWAHVEQLWRETQQERIVAEQERSEALEAWSRAREERTENDRLLADARRSFLTVEVERSRQHLETSRALMSRDRSVPRLETNGHPGEAATEPKRPTKSHFV